MGCNECHNSLDNSSFNNKKIFIELAKAFQEQTRNKKELVSFILKAYLIPTKSLPIFISLMKKYKILDNLYKDPSEIIDLNSTKEFPEFELNKGLEIIDSFSQCKNFIQNNKPEDNEFIIVNDKFMEYMKQNSSENKKALIYIDNEKKVNEIKFNDAQRSQNIILEEKSIGIFKCNIFECSIINKNNNSNINFLGSFLGTNNNNNQIIKSRRKSNDSNFTWDKLIKEGIISDNNYFLQGNPNQFISDFSNKIKIVVDSKSAPTSN